ncbi:hypothetical protein SNE26_08005 [Mucilaginibacter sp. cycad4]|uniref:hypothetical protein n=1 Tax=Mucilaginibacter sp. cycad4 TaxID=3342096 RepID=UPI002AAB313B|nr:hypothetical protein [Mucilaginibacter gossypii]WPV01712.1 hypothetical protein SNE26_08005 [Mucilaginibacter gossypii]
MMNDLQIKLHKGQLDELKDEPASLLKFLNVLFEPFSENCKQLKYALEREFRPEGSPEVVSLNFDRIKFDQHTGQGSFRIVLDIDYAFGCEDLVTHKKNQTSEWTFLVDYKLLIISFYSSPYTDSRTTADEF